MAHYKCEECDEEMHHSKLHDHHTKHGHSTYTQITPPKKGEYATGKLKKIRMR